MEKMSKAEIIAAIRQNKPNPVARPASFIPLSSGEPNLEVSFTGMLNQIGGQVLNVENWEEIESYVREHFRSDERVVTTIRALQPVFETVDPNADPHSLADVSLAVLPGVIGVAENAAIWLADMQLGVRVLPFICQHLAIVLQHDQLLETMHEAYDHLGNSVQDFGVFIAGPSKTADIEQSLVIGAHGARSLTVFLLQQPANNLVQR